jgi:hypothetical protein
MRLFILLLTAVAASAAPRAGVSHHRSTYCKTCERDRYGRIKRSSSAKRAFRSQNPCPATGRTSGACPGFVVDHVKALKHGGADAPENMQWERIADAKAKDRIE